MSQFRAGRTRAARDLAVAVLAVFLSMAAADAVGSEASPPSAAAADGTMPRATHALAGREAGGFCGNSMLDDGEQCDDGNTDDGDGCDSLCQVEDGFSCTLPVDGDAVADGSFENGGLLTTGSPNPDWAETGNVEIEPGVLNTPICDVQACGAGVLDPGFARSGNMWAAFGRAFPVTGQVQRVAQTVVIPVEASDISFWLRRVDCDSSGGAADVIALSIDAAPLFMLACDSVETDYVLYTVPLAGFADGASHVIVFRGLTSGTTESDLTLFVLDDLSIATGPVPSECTECPGPAGCTELCEDFSFDGPAGGDLSGFTRFNTGSLPLDWGTTDDGVCASVSVDPGNYTGGGGEAACIDTDQAGPGLVDAWLCTPRINRPAALEPEYSVRVNYQVFGNATLEDRFAILKGTEAPAPDTVPGYSVLFETSENIGVYQGLGEPITGPLDALDGYLCLQYTGDYDWYAMADNLRVTASRCGIADQDEDGSADDEDNCIEQVNPGQTDTDADGHGNACDPDYNQDCAVNFLDLGILNAGFTPQPYDPNVDLTGENGDPDGAVNFLDLGRLRELFFTNGAGPGPSAAPSLCSAAR